MGEFEEFAAEGGDGCGSLHRHFSCLQSAEMLKRKLLCSERENALFKVQGKTKIGPVLSKTRHPIISRYMG